MNFIKALHVILVLVLLKYLQIKITKSRLRANLETINAKDIIIKLERIEYKYDVYCAKYELDGSIIEKHAICDCFLSIRWL